MLGPHLDIVRPGAGYRCRRRYWHALLLVAAGIPALLIGGVAVRADAGPEGLIAATRPPGPSGTSADRQVVVAEGEDGGDGADDEAEEDIEAVVPEVEPSRAGNEDRCEEWENSDQEQVNRGRSRLSPHCEHLGVVRIDILRHLGVIRVG